METIYIFLTFLLFICFNIADPIDWNIPSEITVEVGDYYELDIPVDAFLPDNQSPFKVSVDTSQYEYLDVENFTPEVIGGVLNHAGWTMSMQWYGDYLYVIDYYRLVIYDVSDPYNSFEVGVFEYYLHEDLLGLCVQGDYAYFIKPWRSEVDKARIVIVDVSDKTSPTLAYDPELEYGWGIFNSIYVFEGNNVAYIGNNVNSDTNGVLIVNLENLDTSGIFTFGIDVPGVKEIKVYEHEGSKIAFFSSTCDSFCPVNLYIYNVDNPSVPFWILDFVDNTGWLRGFDYDEDREILFIGEGEEGLEVFDMSNLYAPSNMATYNTVFEPAHDMKYSHTSQSMLLYTASGWYPGVGVYNVTDPTSPDFIGFWEDEFNRGQGTELQYLDVHPYEGKDILYLGGGGRGIYFFDVGIPPEFELVRHYAWTAGTVFPIEVYGDYLFFCSLSQYFLKILDISDPSSTPRVIGSYLLDDLCLAITYQEEDQILFISDEDSNLISLDVSDMTRPRLLSTFVVGSSDKDYHTLYNNIAYFQSLEDHCMPRFVDVSNASDPNLVVADYGADSFRPFIGYMDEVRGHLYLPFDDTSSLIGCSFALLDVSNNTADPTNPHVYTSFPDLNLVRVSCSVTTQVCVVLELSVSGKKGEVRFINVADPDSFTFLGSTFNLENRDDYGIFSFGDFYINDHIVAFGASGNETGQDEGGVITILDVTDFSGEPTIVTIQHEPEKGDGSDLEDWQVYGVNGRGNLVYYDSGEGIKIFLAEQGVSMINITAPDVDQCGDHHIEIVASDLYGETVHNVTLKIRDSRYVDAECKVTICFGILSNDTASVCSGYGTCIAPANIYLGGTCSCETGFYGEQCEVFKCGGIFSNETSTVCSGQLMGDCLVLNTTDGLTGICVCKNDASRLGLYPWGDSCQFWNCSGVPHDLDSETCNNHGTCSGPETCTCDDDYFGDFCNETYCDGFWYNDPEVCHGHGKCVIDTQECDCVNYTLYSGEFCESWMCFENRNSDQGVCTSHGECVDVDTCDCDGNEYTGDECEFWSCWGINVMALDEVCSGHGFCVDQDFCICFEGYSSEQAGWNCSNWFCGKQSMDDTDVCSQRGECVEYNSCDCRDSYEGEICETWSCGFDKDDEENTCSGHGECISPDECICNGGFAGSRCQTDIVLIATVSPAVTLAAAVVGIIILCVVCCCCCIACFFTMVICALCGIGCIQKAKVSQYSKLKNFDVLLKEQIADSDTSIAHLHINNGLFEVNFDEITIDEMLGEGGSSSIVYRAKWNNTVVAFKCFKTRMICQNQETFDTFEKEIEVMASISHPNVVTFFGATLEQPRIGIVMEFCENGDLFQFLQKINGVTESVKKNKKKQKQAKQRKYPLKEKVRMLHEVVQSMDYLHSRGIIHRDLKLENVLVDATENCKLMDFGLSTIVDRMSQVKTTRIGTQLYMAPEVLSDSKYSEKCDVFSFSIFIYVFLTEIWEPYGDKKEAIHIEIKVSSDPKFRPPLPPYDNLIPTHPIQWIRDLMISCWQHDGDSRPSFSEMNDVFKQKLGEMKEEEDDEQFLDYKNNEDEVKILTDATTTTTDIGQSKDEKIRLLRNELEEVKGKYLELKEKNGKE